MKRRRHTPEQVVRKLREADRLLAEGKEVPEVDKHLEVSEATYHRWRAQYGWLKAGGGLATYWHGGSRGSSPATSTGSEGQPGCVRLRRGGGRCRGGACRQRPSARPARSR
jgi:Transposase